METVKAGQQYRITLTVDEAFLTDPNTVYPVTIDPILTVSDNTHGAGAIEDAPIYEGYPTSNFGSYQYNRAGYAGTTYKKGRTVVRLKGMLNDEHYSKILGAQIESVKFYIADATGTSNVNIKLFPLTSNSTWTENNVTWRNVGTCTDSPADTAAPSGGNYAYFNLTNLAKAWKRGSYFGGQSGFVLVGANESSVDKSLYSSEHATTAKRPYVVAKYSVNEFYSSYADADLYRNTSLYVDDGLQLRANCYGYAFRFFYCHDSFFTEMCKTSETGNQYYCYKQTPGEFKDKTTDGLVIRKADGSSGPVATLLDYKDLLDFVNGRILVDSEPAETRMNYLVQLMEADAKKLDYSLTEYTGTGIPNATDYGDRRLIAVVLSETDYHFYMQHSDNTWSHKPGALEPSNRCIDCELLLDNSNIRAHAAEGSYAGGLVKFFYITKNAVVDYGHLRGTAVIKENGQDSYLKYTEIWDAENENYANLADHVDHAGNYFVAAKELGVCQQVNSTGNIDYVNDVDFYSFKMTQTKAHSFTASTVIGCPIVFTLYDQSGVVLKTVSSQAGVIAFTYTLTANEEYVISISTPSQSAHAQSRKYSYAIT